MSATGPAASLGFPERYTIEPNSPAMVDIGANAKKANGFKTLGYIGFNDAYGDSCFSTSRHWGSRR